MLRTGLRNSKYVTDVSLGSLVTVAHLFMSDMLAIVISVRTSGVRIPLFNRGVIMHGCCTAYRAP